MSEIPETGERTKSDEGEIACLKLLEEVEIDSPDAGFDLARALLEILACRFQEDYAIAILIDDVIEVLTATRSLEDNESVTLVHAGGFYARELSIFTGLLRHYHPRYDPVPDVVDDSRELLIRQLELGIERAGTPLAKGEA